jgi:MFS family permease
VTSLIESSVLSIVYDIYGRKIPILILTLLISVSMFMTPFVGIHQYALTFVSFVLLAAAPTLVTNPFVVDLFTEEGQGKANAFTAIVMIFA